MLCSHYPLIGSFCSNVLSICSIRTRNTFFEVTVTENIKETLTNKMLPWQIRFQVQVTAPIYILSFLIELSPEQLDLITTASKLFTSDSSFSVVIFLTNIHTLRVHYAHAAANLNSGYSKYAKVARVHYFCTIALRTSRAVLTRAWASRRVDLRERKVDSFSKRVIIFWW